MSQSLFWPEFCGGTYQALSPTFAADDAVNVYAETRKVGGSAKQVTLYGTPGLDLQTTVGTTGCRGWFTQDDRTWVVVGNTLYEYDEPTNVATSRGTIANDGFPVSFASNGRGGDQLGIVGGGSLYVLDLNTNVLTGPVALPFSNPVMMAFIDGYGLINEADSPIVWFSNLEDFTTWDALDFFARSGTSDNIVGIGVSRDRVWCLGSKTTTLFYNSGDIDTPFLPYPGTAMQTGLVSPWLMGFYADTLCWVAQSSRGDRRVVVANEPVPQDVTTPAIDRWLSTCTTLADAELMVYEQGGHAFIVITAPSSTEDVCTYVYDLSEQLWHARADWDSVLGVYERWRVRGMTAAGQGRILCGDSTTGKLYELKLDTYDNDGDILKRQRTTPYVSAENQWLFLDQVELGVQPGVGTGSGSGENPTVELEVSRDGSQTWVSAGSALLGDAGAIGAYETRCIWRRLGRSRSDRLVLRMTMTDPVKCAWVGAWLRISPGTGQL